MVKHLPQFAPITSYDKLVEKAKAKNMLGNPDYHYVMYLPGLSPFPLIIISDWWNKCVEYSEKRRPQLKNSYKESGQNDVDKKVLDERYGKAGEVVAMKTIGCSIGVTKLDFKIYEFADKSWKPDLFSGDGKMDFAVKACVRSCDEPSWLIQNDPNGRRDEEILNPRPNLFMVFVVVDPVLKTGRVVSIIPTTSLCPTLFAPLRKKTIVGKMAIYYTGLKSHNLIRGI